MLAACGGGPKEGASRELGLQLTGLFDQPGRARMERAAGAVEGVSPLPGCYLPSQSVRASERVRMCVSVCLSVSESESVPAPTPVLRRRGRRGLDLRPSGWKSHLSRTLSPHSHPSAPALVALLSLKCHECQQGPNAHGEPQSRERS